MLYLMLCYNWPFANETSDIVSTHRSHHQSVVAIHDATGKKISVVHRGVNIILYADGTRRKFVNK